MKYICLKCEREFEATYDPKCPKCGACGTDDLMSLYKYKQSHANQTEEVPVRAER